MDGTGPQSVVLGYGGAWGTAPGDLTSPARVAAVGAFTDSAMYGLTTPPPEPMPISELRVHGVSGSDGPTMLEHPHALQVAGDSTTMFYRRWTPTGVQAAGVPWRLEAYSWGGLTEKAWASAAWILLTPFMLYNVGHFALPLAKSHTLAHAEQRLSRDSAHRFAQYLLRVLAVAATVQLVLAAVCAFVNTIAVQARNAKLPGWLNWYQDWAPDLRVLLGTLAVVVVIGAMWFVSVKTASRYEARIAGVRPRADLQWPLTQPGFWKGEQLVRRQRALHTAAGFAITALAVARPERDMGAGRLIVCTVAALVLLAVVVSLWLPFADRFTMSLGEMSVTESQQRASMVWCWVLQIAALGAVVASVFTWSGNQTPTGPLVMTGLTAICWWLLAVQVWLLILLGLTVWFIARRGSTVSDPESGTVLKGHLTTVLITLAIGVGGTLGVLVNLIVARMFGAPVIGHDVSTSKHALAIPWPVWGFTAAPLALLVGLVLGAIPVLINYFRNIRRFIAASDVQPSAVSTFYATSDMPAANYEIDAYKKRRKQIGKAWARALVTDQVGVTALIAAAAMVVGTAFAQFLGWYYAQSAGSNQPRWFHGFTSFEGWVGLVLAGGLVALLRTVFKNPTRRKTIGALWDVGTFWPRANHPLAPPCYAERAVPELVDRVRILTGTVVENPDDPAWARVVAERRDSSTTPNLNVPVGPVLLTGYSQGSVIAPAVIAQLPEQTRSKTALLTLACPARRLYGRAFPGYFGPAALDHLQTLLTPMMGNAARPAACQEARWKNLVRRTDFIGSWIFAEPKPAPGANPAASQPGVDQPCWDPVTLTTDVDRTPPPIHRHSDFWSDQRVSQLAAPLVACLVASDRTAPATATLPAAATVAAATVRPEGTSSDGASRTPAPEPATASRPEGQS